MVNSTSAQRLVLWDVDGTLVASQSVTAHKHSFSLALKEVFGLDAHIDEMQHNGLTDKLILQEMLLRRNYAPSMIAEKLPQCFHVMTQYCTVNYTSDSLIVLPGVRAVLDSLSRQPDVIQGLLTGNLEPIAHGKMKRVGLDPFLPLGCVGGFGSDEHCTRSDLVGVAIRRATERHGFVMAPDGSNVFVIGDTPRDIEAARSAGVRSVAVATGVFAPAALLEHHPDRLYTDLSDTNAVVSWLTSAELC